MHDTHMKLKPLAGALTSLLAAGIACQPVYAATRIWDGNGANDNWGYVNNNPLSPSFTNTNWTDPSLTPLPKNGDSLSFQGTTRLTPFNDLSNLDINGITFGISAGKFTLRGNRINLNGPLQNNSNQHQTITMPITVSGRSIWDGGTAGMSIENLDAIHLFSLDARRVSLSSTTPLFAVGTTASGVLKLQSGSTLVNENGYIGLGNNSDGDVLVNGENSRWTNSADLRIGGAGFGSLTVDNGGTVTSRTSVVGDSSTGVGSVILRGSGSTLDNSGAFFVGREGQGEVLVEKGATLRITGIDEQSLLSRIGSRRNSSGSVIVRDTGSVWDHRGTGVDIGASGNGSLTLENGGRFNSENGINVGKFSDGKGSIKVTGEGSILNERVFLDVGLGGNGSLIVENGGTVNSNSMHIAVDEGSTGEAIVDGTGSILSSRDISVGSSGSGTMLVRNGGTVFNELSLIGYSMGEGRATIEGDGSAWNGSRMFVGGIDDRGGQGEVFLLKGGELNLDEKLTIGINGRVNLNGGVINTPLLDLEGGVFDFKAGTMNITEHFNWPDDSQNNELVLTGIKTLNVNGTTTLTRNGFLTLDGGTFTTGKLSDSGGFEFRRGTFKLTGDDLTIGSGGLFGGQVQFDREQTVEVSQNITVDAGSALTLNDGRLSGGAIRNNGRIEMNGYNSELGGSLANAGLLTGTGQISADFENKAGGEVRALSDNELYFTGSNNRNQSRITLAGGNVSFSQGLVNNSGGLITGRGLLDTGTGLENQGNLAFSGTADVIGDVNNVGNGKIVVSGGSTATFYDDLVHNGSEFRVSADSSAVFFGEVSGAGAYTGSGTLYFEGDLGPGNSPALINIEGNVVLGSFSFTNMELSGLTRGSEYDAFDIGGNLYLDGSLQIDLLADYKPTYGDSFDLFSANAIFGDFDTILFPELANGLDWRLTRIADDFGNRELFRVTAVPLPSAIWFFGSGLLLLIRRKA